MIVRDGLGTPGSTIQMAGIAVVGMLILGVVLSYAAQEKRVVKCDANYDAVSFREVQECAAAFHKTERASRR